VAATFNTWRGLWAPRGLTAEHIEFWDAVLEKVSRDALWKETLDTNHWDSDHRGSHDTLRYLDSVHAELRDVLMDLGLAKRMD
jgi:putative tricarboxylic transport membrane protein